MAPFSMVLSRPASLAPLWSSRVIPSLPTAKIPLAFRCDPTRISAFHWPELLGTGEDRLALEDGFTINSAAKGGSGTGTIEAAVDIGITRSLDLEPPGFEKSEIIEKTRAGTLISSERR